MKKLQTGLFSILVAAVFLNRSYSQFFATKALSHQEMLRLKTSAKKLSFLNH